MANGRGTRRGTVRLAVAIGGARPRKEVCKLVEEDSEVRAWSAPTWRDRMESGSSVAFAQRKPELNGVLLKLFKTIGFWGCKFPTLTWTWIQNNSFGWGFDSESGFIDSSPISIENQDPILKPNIPREKEPVPQLILPSIHFFYLLLK